MNQHSQATMQPDSRREHGTAPALPALPRLLDVNAVAEMLGVPPRYVRRLAGERRIPYIKWGRYLRFDPIEMDQWLNESRHAARRARRIS